MSDAQVSTPPLVAIAPRPHPNRCRLGLYPIVDTNQARYADMDVNGHLNNLALEALHENARAVLNLRVMPTHMRPIDGRCESCHPRTSFTSLPRLTGQRTST